MILVVEDGSEFPDGNMYSLMCLRGTTYTEEDFRVWVSYRVEGLSVSYFRRTRGRSEDRRLEVF